MRILKNIYFSFPVQLMVLHFKKHQLLLFLWILLFAMVTKDFGKSYGIPYLFLDPEYLGNTNIYGFLILGIAYGGFVMTWNVTHYILNSFRFPFLATLQFPFAKYCLNNAILPLAFIIVYFSSLLKFQINLESYSNQQILIYASTFIGGMSIVMILSLTYFFNMNKNIFKMFGIMQGEKEPTPEEIEEERKKKFDKSWRVDYYLSNPFRTRIVRSVRHYQKHMIRSVFRQHHINAVIVESGAFIILISLSMLMDLPYFRIPAGASILLLFSILIMLLGAFSFWMRGWRTIGFVALLFLLNYMIRYNVFNYISQANGIDYSQKPALYDLDNLKKLSDKDNREKDRNQTLQILSTWRKKFTGKTNKKPKIIFIHASGGGLRSAIWTMNVLQTIDSLTEGKVFNNTILISGASAGMIGSAYFRELKLRSLTNDSINPSDKKYLNNLSQDILNPICFTLVVNDFFVPWQKFESGGRRYSKDRGYMFEKILDENTGSVLSKTLGDYSIPERNAVIPMMLISPVITNNGQRLYISSQPISYMTLPADIKNVNAHYEIDAVEFSSFFKDHDALNMSFLSALRMNASFPYITPFVSLPSEPSMIVMDAGARDNFGYETSVRFLHNFSDWIEHNTSGVIFLQIRDTKKHREIEGKLRQSIIDKILNPIGNFYSNWAKFQDFFDDNLISYSGSWFDKNLDVVTFQYIPRTESEEVSLSWHLTKREKTNILNAIHSEQNQAEMNRIKDLIAD